jgi:hypothetical protein
MAGIQGTNIVAPVVPLDTADVHPTHEALYGKGGYRTVATTVERDAIPAARREAGMLVFVTADGQRYRLGTDLTTWTVDAAGASAWADITGKPATFDPSAHASSHAAAGSDPITVGTAADRIVVTSSGGKLTTASRILTTQVQHDTGTQLSSIDSLIVDAASYGLDAAITLHVTKGTTSETVCVGNDSRLSDSRTPTSHVHAAGDITSGTLARARYAADLGSGSMTVSGSNSYGVSLDATARTLSQANTLSIMGGPVGIGTLTPLSAGGLEVAASNETGNREILRIRNKHGTNTGYFDIGVGTTGYFQNQTILSVNGTVAMRILDSPAGQIIFPSSLRMPNSQQIIGDSNANAYIEMNNGGGQLSLSSVSVMSFQRSYVEVGRWDTNSVWNVGTGHASAASSGGSSVTGTQARVRFPGQVSSAAGMFAAAGDAQASRYHLRNNTADATATTLFRNGSSTLLVVPARSTWAFKIRVTAYNSTDEIGAAWNVVGAIRRNAANGTALVGSVTSTAYTEGAMSGASVAVTADDTNEALQISVTGLASKAIRWHAVVETSEVSAGTPS